MFRHISLGVQDLSKAVHFYDEVMKTLGHNRLFGDIEEEFMAYGPKDSFFIICTPLEADKSTPEPCNATHLCFAANSKEDVDNFHKMALNMGGADAGAPGLRPCYSEDYYA
ncbi:MAG: VOC family protein, partial [Alphaproteobacteria bacterium]|nr:VOC family protein [Alphaproteobacteria bacterium]